MKPDSLQCAARIVYSSLHGFLTTNSECESMEEPNLYPPPSNFRSPVCHGEMEMGKEAGAIVSLDSR